MRRSTLVLLCLFSDVGLWNNPGDWFDPAYALPVSLYTPN